MTAMGPQDPAKLARVGAGVGAAVGLAGAVAGNFLFPLSPLKNLRTLAVSTAVGSAATYLVLRNQTPYDITGGSMLIVPLLITPPFALLSLLLP